MEQDRYPVETEQVIWKRRSHRVFSDKPIPSDLKARLLDGTLRAPTAGNMMLYSIIDVQDPEIKGTLAESCDHQPWIAEAPIVLLFLADYQRWLDLFLDSGLTEDEPMRNLGLGDLLLAASDALIAAQTTTILAESLGLASCYVGDIIENYETHRELFGLPSHAVPITMLCLGYPKGERAAQPKTPRLATEAVVHTDRYRRRRGKELEALFEPLSRRYEPTHGADGRLEALLARMYGKFTAPFSQEMNRSVEAAIEEWRKGANR